MGLLKINTKNMRELVSEEEAIIRQDFHTQQDALGVIKEHPSFEICRYYYKEGELIGSEPLSNIDLGKPQFKDRETADEYIDAESEADAIQGTDIWYIGYRDPKDSQFKGEVLKKE